MTTYENGLPYKPLLEPHYEVIQQNGTYDICVYLNEMEVEQVSNVNQLLVRIVKNEIYLEDKNVYIYLEGISDKVLKAISDKKATLNIYHELD